MVRVRSGWINRSYRHSGFSSESSQDSSLPGPSPFGSALDPIFCHPETHPFATQLRSTIRPPLLSCASHLLISLFPSQSRGMLRQRASPEVNQSQPSEKHNQWKSYKRPQIRRQKLSILLRIVSRQSSWTITLRIRSRPNIAGQHNRGNASFCHPAQIYNQTAAAFLC